MYELSVHSQTFSGRIRPVRALRALLAFVRDPDDTPQVYRIVRALDGSTAERAFLRFCSTATGRALLTRRESLADVLTDRQSIRALPEHSLGRAYLDFVENERISVEGLQDAAVRGGLHTNQLERGRLVYRGRLSAMHDLLHVITGYGTDELGETCLLAFTYAQNRTRGLLPIIFGLTMRQMLRFPRLKVVRAVREGFALGRDAHWLTSQDWETLLARPLAEVRSQLAVRTPDGYLGQLELSRDLDDRRRKRLKPPARPRS